MAFNPLGKFEPAAALNPAVVAAGHGLYAVLAHKYPCPHGTISRIYDHWTVGHYGQDFPDYNVCVRYDKASGHFYLDVSGNPQDNAVGVDDAKPHSHTFERNTGAVGIATDDMVFASQHDFGPEPLTLLTLEFLCAANAAVAAAYGVDLSGLSVGGPYAGEPNLLTHGEAANRPGNPHQYANYYVSGERWDLASFVPLPPGMTNADINPAICGNALRERSHRYKLAIV